MSANTAAGAAGSRFAAAQQIVREAGAIARAKFNGRPGTAGINLKGAQDYLSALDAEVEGLIRTRLLESFPEDAFFGEEGGGSFEGNVWVVDPIDGTANFVRGIAQFCISVAFVSDGGMEIGLIYDPMLDEMFAAERGRGATLNGEAIRVSGLDDIRATTVEAGWSTRLPLQRYVDMVARLFDAGTGVRRGGSGALALAYVAAGRIDGYCELHMNSWDALAGLLLVREAGGWTNDFLAGSGLREGNAVLACTPGIGDTLVHLTGIA